MASILERLKRLGIGTVTPEYRARQADKRLAESFKIPYKPYAPIEERTLNTMRPKSMANVNVPVGDVMTGMPGVQGMTDMGLFAMPPAGPAAQPVRRDIVPPQPADREIPQDVLPLVERPDLPSYLTAADVPVPVRPDMSMPRREAPIPGAGLFEPPAMEPRVEKPTLDTAIQNLMARYDALYSDQPPVAPEARMPEPRDLGLPAFTTPGYFPEGMMTPRVQQPNIQPPAIQPYQPDMFEFDYGSLNPQTAPDFSRMTDEEIDAYYSNILGY